MINDDYFSNIDQSVEKKEVDQLLDQICPDDKLLDDSFLMEIEMDEPLFGFMPDFDFFE